MQRSPTVFALLLIALVAGDAAAFSGFKGRFQGRCTATDGVVEICGVGVSLPGARNGARLTGGGYTFVCRSNSWQILGGGRTCCGVQEVEVCGERQTLPVGERGEEVWVRAGASREVMYRCDGRGWSQVDAEVWGLCRDLLKDLPGAIDQKDRDEGPRVLEWD